MQPKALAEPFWSDIQTLLDRHPVVEATRTGQRHRAIAQTMLRLDHQLSRLLAELDVTGLLQQCHAANPPLPRMRVENLLNSELWQRRDGLFGATERDERHAERAVGDRAGFTELNRFLLG